MSYYLMRGKEIVGEVVKLGDVYQGHLFKSLRLTQEFTAAELRKKRLKLVLKESK